MKRLLWSISIIGLAAGHALAQTVSFNFSSASHAVSGWINVTGDPSTATITASDATSGISLSSVSKNNWSPAAGSSFDGGGASGSNPFFPNAVLANHWFNYSAFYGAYNALMPQLIISGLNIDSVYTFKMTGSFVLGVPQTYELNPIRYTVAGASLYGYIDVDGDSNYVNGATFHNVAPDSAGQVRIYVNTYGGSNVASICGLQIISGHTSAPSPTVTITNPTSNAIIPEDGNVTLSATATETGGSINKVEFYAGSTLIGSDSTAPYSMTWFSPDPGPYTITARAIDGTGNISTTSVNIVVESLNYFWSTTGNIATGGDTSFVGTVDSNRLAFRTKNIERMSILPTGNIGIGTIMPTAQFHTTGSVRLAGLTSDSSQNRMLVSDTSGNLYYRNMSSLGSSLGTTLGGGLGQTSGGTIALGDSIPGLGPHSFISDRYQYLNGYQYSFGGSVNDPVTRPVFRLYNNGDLAVSTTMDTGSTAAVPRGLRYYSKLGVLQIGSRDRLDTTGKVSAMNGGIVLDCEDSATTSVLKAVMYDAFVAGNGHNLDSTASLGTSMVNGGYISMSNGGYSNSIISGYGLRLTGGIDNSIVTGNANIISKGGNTDVISGFLNQTMDTTISSLVSGGLNQFGGESQTVSGIYLTNRTPAGATLGSGNVDFATLPYTGTQGLKAPGLAGYPLFAVGNASSSNGVFKSNALTVLYNGRTQINTTGFSTGLTQTQVTPAAALDVVSTNSGVLLPRLTNAQRNAIVSGDLVNGLLLYNTDSSVFQYYNGSAWNSVGSGSGGSSGRWSFVNGTNYDSLDNVGIGTNNTQGYRLAVNGAGIFVKIVAKPQASWPDYVFDKGYRLMPLQEVGQYILLHHHLPGVTPESEVMQTGIDLGEQQTTTLKKVEELTLYLIHENESLAEQNRQMTLQARALTDQAKQLADQHALLEAQQKEIDELKAMIGANHNH